MTYNIHEKELTDGSCVYELIILSNGVELIIHCTSYEGACALRESMMLHAVDWS